MARELGKVDPLASCATLATAHQSESFVLDGCVGNSLWKFSLLRLDCVGDDLFDGLIACHVSGSFPLVVLDG